MRTGKCFYLLMSDIRHSLFKSTDDITRKSSHHKQPCVKLTIALHCLSKNIKVSYNLYMV